MELLFEGRANLGGMSGNLRFIQPQPNVHPEPVLRPDSPGDAQRVSLYGTVLREQGRYRMWYYAVPQASGSAKMDGAFVAYAESDDGIAWRKPALNIVEAGLGPNNLTNLGMHSATLFSDPESPPERRYHAAGCGAPHYPGNHQNVAQAGYYTAHSTDGLRWNLDSPTPRWASSDVITCAYHPGRKSAMIALKYTPRWMRMARRCIHTAEFSNGMFSEAVTALYPDEFDDLCAVNKGFHSCDYYGMGMQPAGRGMVGFLWKYWHELPYCRSSGNGAQALYGRSDVALAYQPEPGGRWLHAPGRPVFLDRDRIPQQPAWINTASNVVEADGEHRLYFSYCLFQHGYGLDESWKRIPSIELSPAHTAITFAYWPAWRLFGFESLPEGTLQIQLDNTNELSEIFLNYEIIRPDGFIRAGIQSETPNEFSIENSLPLTGSSTGAKIIWKAGSVLPTINKARLALHLNAARVYAYEVKPAAQRGIHQSKA